MDKERLQSLIDDYLAGNCSESEKEFLEEWIKKRQQRNTLLWRDDLHKISVKDEIYQRLEPAVVHNAGKSRGIKRLYWQLGLVGMIVISISLGYFFNAKQDIDQTSLVVEAVKPGTKAAVLVLGDGSKVDLNETESGVFSRQDKVEIRKVDGGQILYDTEMGAEVAMSDKVTENTLIIPKGGQYKVVLPDGTAVWMNSDSKLVYPVRFDGKERKVTLWGEAYFDVAKNATQPFIVKADDVEIKVFGTQFNIRAYGDDSGTSATLIEGSIEAKKGNNIIKMRPGQQVVSKWKDGGLSAKEVDVNTVVAWKRGYFSFDGQDIEEVMKDVSRWYDLEVSFIGDRQKKKTLGGTFSRSKSIDELLTNLGVLAEVKINRKERRVTILY